jgi:hypothetical protein
MMIRRNRRRWRRRTEPLIKTISKTNTTTTKTTSTLNKTIIPLVYKGDSLKMMKIKTLQIKIYARKGEIIQYNTMNLLKMRHNSKQFKIKKIFIKTSNLLNKIKFPLRI